MASLDETRDELRAEFSSRLLGGNPVLEQSNFDVMADFIGFLQFANEVGLEAVASGLTPISATGDLLKEWGGSFGVDPLPASTASGDIRISGLNGSTLPAGTLLTRCDGVEYLTTDDVTISGGIAVANVESRDTGPDVNFYSGGVLDMGAVVPGIDGTAISEGITGGADIECDDLYRVRVISAIRTPCRVGTTADYEYWARLYPGVTRVCVLDKGAGPGTVKIFVMMDNTYPNGAPAIADVKAIDEMIFGDGGFAPDGVVGQVCVPSICPVDVRIEGIGQLSSAEFNEIRDHLENAFLDFFNCGGSVVCRADLEVALREITDLCFEITEPASNVTIEQGCVPILGAMTIA